MLALLLLLAFDTAATLRVGTASYPFTAANSTQTTPIWYQWQPAQQAYQWIGPDDAGIVAAPVLPDGCTRQTWAYGLYSLSCIVYLRRGQADSGNYCWTPAYGVDPACTGGAIETYTLYRR